MILMVLTTTPARLPQHLNFFRKKTVCWSKIVHTTLTPIFLTGLKVPGSTEICCVTLSHKLEFELNLSHGTSQQPPSLCGNNVASTFKALVNAGVMPRDTP